VAGAKKYARVKNAQNEKYVAVLAAANMDFDRLRFVSERSDDRERFMAVKIPEKIGSFQELYDVICTLVGVCAGGTQLQAQTRLTWLCFCSPQSPTM
jgi:hypothetical protein